VDRLRCDERHAEEDGRKSGICRCRFATRASPDWQETGNSPCPPFLRHGIGLSPWG
jgi:hypothetical protein